LGGWVSGFVKNCPKMSPPFSFLSTEKLIEKGKKRVSFFCFFFFCGFKTFPKGKNVQTGKEGEECYKWPEGLFTPLEPLALFSSSLPCLIVLSPPR
jgi:hypothetical protein